MQVEGEYLAPVKGSKNVVTNLLRFDYTINPRESPGWVLIHDFT